MMAFLLYSVKEAMEDFQSSFQRIKKHFWQKLKKLFWMCGALDLKVIKTLPEFFLHRKYA